MVFKISQGLAKNFTKKKICIVHVSDHNITYRNRKMFKICKIRSKSIFPIFMKNKHCNSLLNIHKRRIYTDESERETSGDESQEDDERDSEEEEEQVDYFKIFPKFKSPQQQLKYFEILNQTIEGKLTSSEIQSLLKQNELFTSLSLLNFLSRFGEKEYVELYSPE